MFFYDAPEGQGEQYQVDIVTDVDGISCTMLRYYDPNMTPIMNAYSFQGFMFYYPSSSVYATLTAARIINLLYPHIYTYRHCNCALVVL